MCDVAFFSLVFSLALFFLGAIASCLPRSVASANNPRSSLPMQPKLVSPFAQTKQSVSMQPGNRVVLMCVGGKDSYAVFEAANDDAAAVLYVGEKRVLLLLSIFFFYCRGCGWVRLCTTFVLRVFFFFVSALLYLPSPVWCLSFSLVYSIGMVPSMVRPQAVPLAQLLPVLTHGGGETPTLYAALLVCCPRA